MKKIYLVSLGCPKNLVDSEVMLAALLRCGYALTQDPEKADILLVNTCGFIQPAVEEAIDEVLALAAYKKQDPDKWLVVTGCLVQRYGEELRQSLPEVDLFVGLDDFVRIGQLLREPAPGGSRLIFSPGPASYLMDSRVARQRATPFFRAYLKITEGCDNHCAYCMIPSIRGRLRSRTPEDLLAEARGLQADGVQGLTLIAQDLSAYGRDRGDADGLPGLLRTLLTGTDIPWLRLLYLYPSGISDQLLQLMADEPRLLPYLDIPFQHVSDAVLGAMNRHYGQSLLYELMGRIRRFVPDCAVRTTLMVGFPGETERDLEMLMAALHMWRISHVGVFSYQAEEGSLAARLPGAIPEEEKERRRDMVMQAQAAISAEAQQRFIGRKEAVLIEGLSQESDFLVEGRTRYQAPDIDGCVYITAGQVNPGDIVTVRITEAHTYDLVGEVI